LYLKK
jgi:amino acid permease